MSRIEKNQPVVEEMEQMEGRIVGAVKRGRGRGWKMWAGLAILSALFVAFAFFVWTLAATGLVNVPVVSGWAYEAPAPTRVVEEGIPFETTLQQQALASSIAISEETLTTELRDALQTSGQTFAEADAAQVAALGKDGIELFLPLRDNALGSAVTVRLRLSAENGALRAEAVEVSVGSWEMGSWLREGLVNPALQGALDAVAERLGGAVSVSSVVTEEGLIRVVPNVP